MLAGESTWKLIPVTYKKYLSLSCYKGPRGIIPLLAVLATFRWHRGPDSTYLFADSIFRLKATWKPLIFMSFKHSTQNASIRREKRGHVAFMFLFRIERIFPRSLLLDFCWSFIGQDWITWAFLCQWLDRGLHDQLRLVMWEWRRYWLN